MAEQQQQSPEMLQALQALLAQAQQQPSPAAGGWAQPQPTAALPITGISIPVKVDTPIGSVRVDLHLPAEFGQSPQALLGAIQALANAGYPVDAWQPRESSGGGWGNSNGGNSVSWGNRSGYGGGYNKGGYGRRW